ncbi:MAG: luciferase family oxidoreductase group 1 [Myxococcota bacterium]|jgi:luciferase family oxidoreductase group 1
MPLLLNMLCQSPVRAGHTAVEAVNETVDLARAAERLGYHRFWVAEHHSDPGLASASPEILIARIASVTERLRVGAGGVLLPHYSAFKVAEQFQLLCALFGDRIDLGLGRAGGTEREAVAALRSELTQRGAPFRHADELLAWLQGSDPRWPRTFASPPGPGPQPWMLGTSPASAKYAADHGLPYAFGGFIDPRQAETALATYHRHFRPSTFCPKPHVNLGWYVLAAETDVEARHRARSAEHWFVQSMLRGRAEPFQRPDDVVDAVYAPHEQMAIEMRRAGSIIGAADSVAERLADLAKRWMVDELTLVTITWDHAHRIASYEALAERLL